MLCRRQHKPCSVRGTLVQGKRKRKWSEARAKRVDWGSSDEERKRKRSRRIDPEMLDFIVQDDDVAELLETLDHDEELPDGSDSDGLEERMGRLELAHKSLYDQHWRTRNLLLIICERLLIEKLEKEKEAKKEEEEKAKKEGKREKKARDRAREEKKRAHVD